jgi:hypothetical protein
METIFTAVLFFLGLLICLWNFERVSGFTPEIFLGTESLKTNKFVTKLMKKPSFCLFEGTDSVGVNFFERVEFSKEALMFIGH